MPVTAYSEHARKAPELLTFAHTLQGTIRALYELASENRAIVMRNALRKLIFMLICSALAGSASAGLCEAPFMHEGGYTQLRGSGALRLGATLNFTQVTKRSAQECEARVNGKATYGLAGLPEGASSLDYYMTVTGGEARFERRETDGTRKPVHGKFDLRMLGLFTYGVPITQAGQTFPEMRFQINVDRKAVDTLPIAVHTGTKRVGQAKTIATAAGQQHCWPVHYTRTIDPTHASFSGIVLPIPGMVATVTDWFCPDLNMVMKQESQQHGMMSIVEVTELR